MSVIRIDNLTFAYPGSFDNVFENANIQIDTDWKLGFVGRNGRGKTTLMRLLRGEFDNEYEGKITSSVSFDYFPYEVSDPDAMTRDVLNAVCPDAQDWEITKELSYLEVDPDVIWRSFRTLSEGEKTKVLLAALFLNPGHFLLIDEPTNHLDLHGREVVASYLNRKKGFILVSHDRHFLDNCVDHILSINKADIEVQKSDFSTWLKGFEERQHAEVEADIRLGKDIRKLRESARQKEDWSNRIEKTKAGGFDKGYIGHMSAKMMKRSMVLRDRREKAIEEKSKLLKNAEFQRELKIHSVPYHSNRLAELIKVAVQYDGKEINAPVSFTIERGDRIFLDGVNGAGKSSLLKLLIGDLIDHSGQLIRGSNLEISYVPQDTSFVKGTLTEFASSQGIDETLFLTILQKMGFMRVQFEKDMSEFSAGQKKKVLLAASLSEKANLYVWDEPLNYVDIYTRRQLEKLIAEYKPTMIMVEHDKAFRDAVATKIIEIKGY
jgi:lincosamide and streptogramin A transport system ATP-binding/permease protein